jgi:acyl carrier protein
MDRDPKLLEDLESRVIDVISKHRRLEPGQITLDSTFADLSIDSLTATELLFEFEEAFDLTIPDEVAIQMKGVRQVVDTLRSALSGSHATASHSA